MLSLIKGPFRQSIKIKKVMMGLILTDLLLGKVSRQQYQTPHKNHPNLVREVKFAVYPRKKTEKPSHLR